MKTVKSRLGVVKLHPKFAAGLRLLDASDKLWARVHRVTGGQPLAAGAPSKLARKVTSLADYRRKGPSSENPRPGGLT